MDKLPQGITVSSTFDHGTHLRYVLNIDLPASEAQVQELIMMLRDGWDFMIEDPDAGDCYRECTLIGLLLHIKRGCHGASGTWRVAGVKAAVDWLLPAIQAAARFQPAASATLTVRKSQP